MQARRSMSVRITGLGIAFLAMLLVTLAGASNENNSFAYLLVFTLLGLFIVAFVKGALSLLPVRLLHLHAESTFADRPVPVRGALTPRDHAIPGLLELTSATTSSGGAGPVMAPGMAPGADGGFELRLPPQPRGRLSLGSLVISTGYPAGLFRWSIRLHGLATAALIYPAPIDHLVAAGRRSPLQAAAESGDFDELAAWREGESLSGICWKSYARSGKRMRKRFLQSSPSSDLCFDWNGLPTLSDEQKRSQLCHWVVDAHRRRARYGLRLPGIMIELASGEPHYRRCLAALAGDLGE